MRYLNAACNCISKVMQMKKTRDIIKEIEEELSCDIIEVLKSLNSRIEELYA